MVVKFDSGACEKKITASKEVINLLSLVFDEASDHLEEKAYYATATVYKQYANQLFQQLDESGYYDDVR